MILRYFAVWLAVLSLGAPALATTQKLLNVSYDGTREFYHDYNLAFKRYYRRLHGEEVSIAMSHSGSAAQAQSVVSGIGADVVTLAVEGDIDLIARRTGWMDANWKQHFPNGSAPYTSAIVFLVRSGNPLGIRDWPDLISTGAAIITPNPKTSAAARYNYLAAYTYAHLRFDGDEERIRDFLTAFYSQVPVLNTGVRGAAITFTRKQIGDVLISWENEAHVAMEKGGGDYEIVTPSISVIARPQVAIVTENARRHGNLALAEEYVRYMYSAEAQELMARHYYRPYDRPTYLRHQQRFAEIQLIDIDSFDGGFAGFSARHFSDGGWFDQIQARLRDAP